VNPTKSISIRVAKWPLLSKFGDFSPKLVSTSLSTSIAKIARWQSRFCHLTAMTSTLRSPFDESRAKIFASCARVPLSLPISRLLGSFPLLSAGYPQQSTAPHLLVPLLDPAPNPHRHHCLSRAWLATSNLGWRKSKTSGFSPCRRRHLSIQHRRRLFPEVFLDRVPNF
jgi:hypothetical protein